MIFEGRRLWFFHGEENFTATPCRLFYVARERISPIIGVRIFTTLWVWQILHGVVGVVMWSINLNWLSLAEMIERKSYYIYYRHAHLFSQKHKNANMQNMSTKASLHDLCPLTKHLNFFYTPPGAWHGKNYGMA